MPLSQATTNPWHQEEEKKDKTNAYKINKQMQEKHIDQLSLFPKWGDHNAKQDWKTQHEMPDSKIHKVMQSVFFFI